MVEGKNSSFAFSCAKYLFSNNGLWYVACLKQNMAKFTLMEKLSLCLGGSSLNSFESSLTSTETREEGVFPQFLRYALETRRYTIFIVEYAVY